MDLERYRINIFVIDNLYCAVFLVMLVIKLSYAPYNE